MKKDKTKPTVIIVKNKRGCVERFRGRDGLHYAHFKSRNGNILATTEGYKQARSITKAVNAVFRLVSP